MDRNDEETLNAFRNFDPLYTRYYFYDYCRRAYNVCDKRYQLANKAGMDFYSLAHDYYIDLVQKDFAPLDKCPARMSLQSWMFGAFRYFILNALRRYNHEYDNLQSLETDQMFAQINTCPIESLIPNVIQEVEQFYNDSIMSRIVKMYFQQGFKQNEIAQQLGITPSAVSQRYHRMMEEVIIPYVYETYPEGVPQEIITEKDQVRFSIGDDDLRFRVSEPVLPFVSQGRVTPDIVKALTPHQVFVFGTDLEGHHYGSSARQALKFGAVEGVGIGPQGNTYAIPTLNGSLDELKKHVDDFIEYARIHPENEFLVVEIGCGLAGYYSDDIAPLFQPAIKIPNVYLPENFWTEFDLDAPASNGHWWE